MDGNAEGAKPTEDIDMPLQDLGPSDAALHESPNLSKRFGSLSINVSSSSPEKRPPSSSGSPRHSTLKSPGSPRLNRKTSSSSLNQLRRTSSSLALSPKASSNASAPTKEERAPVTSASVAADYFRKELVHHIDSERYQSDTLILTHDSCYGHRFARPKTSKTNLSLIFERPERLQAGALGMAHAYVRLGKRHVGGSDPPHPKTEPSWIPFRLKRTPRTLPITSPYVTAVHGTSWMSELGTMCDAAGMRLAAGEKELKRPEETPSNDHSKPHLHEGDLYLCKESRDAFEGALGGVCEAVDAVFQDSGDYQAHKKAFVCIRPPGHHCSADLPSGFCWINNVHVGIEYAAQQHGLTHAAIIDFDLHHGDGSQAIAWERNTKSAKLQAQKQTAKNAAAKKTFIGYFSLHDINSYPCEDGDFDKVQSASVCIDNAHGQSIWNVHLEPYANEAEFWKLYEDKYLVILQKTRNFLKLHADRLRATPGAPQPKAAIFISAGFDASQWETPSMQRHRVNVPTEFYARFTSDIARLAEEEGCAAAGRVISVLEGGYSDRAISSGVLSHVSGLSNTSFSSQPVQHGIAQPPAPQDTPKPQWDTKWWSEAALTELENALRPQPPVPPKRAPRNSEAHSYQSPTHSFMTKAVDPEKVKRTFSTTLGSGPTPPRSRPPTPPPPDVDWTVAALELSKLIIPSDRQINSCRHEELNEPRQKRERHSSIGFASVPEHAVVGERVTRGRKAKTSSNETEVDEMHRRQTVSTLPLTAPPSSTSGSAAPSSRASSSARQPSSNRSDNIQVNKSRRASGTRDELNRQTTMPAPSVPRVPKQHVGRPPSRNNATSGVPPARSGDIDSVTSGLKKITLKLSKEDEEAAAAAKKPTKKAPSSRPLKSLTAAKPAPQPTEETSVKPKEPNATTALAQLDGASDMATVATAAEEHLEQPPNNNGADVSASLAAGGTGVSEAQTNATASSVPQGSGEPTVDPARPGDGAVKSEAKREAPEFVAYDPPGQPMQSATTVAGASTTQDLTWMPTNVNTPVNLAGKKNSGQRLPVFTSTGHIPFAGGPKKAQQGAQPSMLPIARPTASTLSDSKENVAEDATSKAVKEQTTTPSLWDVPTTPQR